MASGATYLYSDPATDGMLLRLNGTPPAGSEFAGWDFALLPASSDIVGIHHPNGDAKKVSSGQQLSRDADQNEVAWLSGTTEGGSSGSGLFTADANGYHLRGGLLGGNASCANTGALANAGNRDYYSRFDLVFPHIASYLAPVPGPLIRANGSQPLVPPRAGAAVPAAAPPRPVNAARPSARQPRLPVPRLRSLQP
jgi:lysyl endopeptidase